jgi:cholesterol transport system auxiliary component
MGRRTIAAKRRSASVLKPVRLLCSVAVLALLTPGCAALGGLGGTPQLDTYELTAPTPDNGRRRGGVQVLIAEPSALKALDGQNIVIKTSPGSIQYLKGAQWADRLPKVVQARLAESFQLSGRFGGVGMPGEGLAIDYQVIVDVRAFEVQVVGGQEQAYVSLYVRVLNDRNGTVRASRTFEATSMVSGTGNDSYVNALDRAFGEAAVAIVEWAAQTI